MGYICQEAKISFQILVFDKLAGFAERTVVFFEFRKLFVF